MADDLTIAEKLIGAGLRTYDKFADRSTMPTNRRIFMESVVDKSKEPITENSFRPDEMSVLRDLILRKYSQLNPAIDKYEAYLSNALDRHQRAVKAKDKDKIMYPEFATRYEADLDAIRKYKQGVVTPTFLEIASGSQDYVRHHALKRLNMAGGEFSPTPVFNVQPVFSYEDYGIESGKARTAGAGADPRAALHTTLGKFRYAVDPETNEFVITDQYDFNPPVSGITGSQLKSEPVTLDSVAMTAEGAGSPLYGLIRNYAGRVLPEGSGRDVRIRLNNLAPVSNNKLLDQ